MNKKRKEISEQLHDLSGGDIGAMLRDVLTPDEVETVAKEAYSAVRGMAEPFGELPPKAKHDWLRPMRDAGFKRARVNDFGWNFSCDLWQSCQTDGIRPSGGRPGIDKDIIAIIRELLLRRSQPIPGRTIVNRVDPSSPVQVRLMDTSWRQIYEDSDLKDTVSYSTFFAHKPPEFVQAGRPSDMCGYCEDRKAAIRSLDQLKSKYKCPTTDTLDDLRIKYSSKPKHAISEAIGIIDEANIHRKLADAQHATYTDVTGNPPPGVLVIDIDWKQKFTLPMGPSNTSSDTYHQTQVAILSVGFYWMQGGERMAHSVDIVSRTITENAYSSVEGLKMAIRHLESQGVLNLTGYSKTQWLIFLISTRRRLINAVRSALSYFNQLVLGWYFQIKDTILI